MYCNSQNPFAAAIARNSILSVSHVTDRIRLRVRTNPSGLDCWIFQPRFRNPSARPVVAVHGIRRQAREQVELLADRARAQGCVIIAPIFDEQRWPRYQQAVVRGRADKALLLLWRDLVEEGVVTDGKFTLSGFSGGAQFAHRFAMLYPDSIESLIVASAGWFTFPDAAQFPYGLTPPAHRRAVDHLAENLRRFLTIPITVVVGERDTKRDPNTRASAEIDEQQGLTRFDRAHNWSNALGNLGSTFGIQPSIRTVVLPRCAHSFSRCVRRGGLDRLILPDNSSTNIRSNWQIPAVVKSALHYERRAA